jgi:hypothetical protein
MAKFDQSSEPLLDVSAKRAAQILEAYGADPTRWPFSERAGTLAALNKFPALANSRQSATDIDHFLGGVPLYTPSADLARRISAAALHEPKTPAWRSWLFDLIPASATPMSVMQPMATLFVAVTLGIMAGAFIPGSDNDAMAEEFMLLAFGPAYQMQTFEDAGGAE